MEEIEKGIVIKAVDIEETEDDGFVYGTTSIPGLHEDGKDVYVNPYIYVSQKGDIVNRHHEDFAFDTGFLSIEILKEIIQKVKNKGATHIALDYQVDHNSYIIGSANVRVATVEEVHQFNNIKKEADNKKNMQDLNSFKRK